MTWLAGHVEITKKALEELDKDPGASALVGELRLKLSLPAFAGLTDIWAIFTGGHWKDAGQKDHFMRQFDEQSEWAAYNEGVIHVHKESLTSATWMAERLRLLAKVKDRSRLPPPDLVDIAHLGNAVHAVQDSFAPAHVLREPPPPGESRLSPSPTPIKHVRRYASDEKAGLHRDAAPEDEPESAAKHSMFKVGGTGDYDWREDAGFFTSSGDWTRNGKLAVGATKDLLLDILRTAVTAFSKGNKPPSELDGWAAYEHKWLQASQKLSRERDASQPLIDRALHVYATMGPTGYRREWSIDAKALAKILYEELGVDMTRVYDVFARLDEHYNLYADDVGEAYVNLLRAEKGQRVEALRQHPNLQRLLIKTMEEGWTTGGERDCIKYLKSLLGWDPASSLIQRFQSGTGMDEDGLARALVDEVNTDMDRAYHVFQNLDHDYNSDVDDVAELYVKNIRTRGGAILEALKGHRNLVALLIRSMKEGYTSSGEMECIKFLRTL